MTVASKGVSGFEAEEVADFGVHGGVHNAPVPFYIAGVHGAGVLQTQREFSFKIAMGNCLQNFQNFGFVFQSHVTCSSSAKMAGRTVSRDRRLSRSNESSGRGAACRMAEIKQASAPWTMSELLPLILSMTANAEPPSWPKTFGGGGTEPLRHTLESVAAAATRDVA